jgi:hypothetical protein
MEALNSTRFLHSCAANKLAGAQWKVSPGFCPIGCE